MGETAYLRKPAFIAIVLAMAVCVVALFAASGQAAPAYASTSSGYSVAPASRLVAQASDDDGGDDSDSYGEYGYVLGYGFQKIGGKKRFQIGPNNRYLKSSWIIEYSKASHSFAKTLPANYRTKYRNCTFYYVGKDGVAYTGWYMFNDGRKYFNSDGVWLRYESQIQEATTYRVNADGTIHPGFLKKGKKTYYIMANGEKATGAKNIDNFHYYFNKKGVMQTGFVKVKGKRYFYDYTTGHKAGMGVEKGYIINYAKKGQCFKLKNYKTGNQNADAKRVAKQIAACCKVKGLSKLERAGVAAKYVAAMSSKCKYTMSGPNYYRAYGVFIAKQYSCAGSTRALGMVLDLLKIKWTHANENKYTHQWCKLKIGKKAAYADGQIGIAGWGKHPAAK